MGNTLYNIKQLLGNNLLSFDERIVVKIKPSKRETSKKKKKPQTECRLSSLILYGDKVGQKFFFKYLEPSIFKVRTMTTTMNISQP